MPRRGRNAPCWCGSGRKYKKCHLNEDEKAEARRHAPQGPPAKEYPEYYDSVLGDRQVRSDEVGPPRED